MSILRAAFRSLGSLSEGIRLGFQTGFDSGEMMDYIYTNRARGRLAAGPLVDRLYLQQVGCRALRNRCRLLTDQLVAEIRRNQLQDLPTHMVDVASGAGRYVLQALERTREAPVTALCRDLDPGALQTGRERARALGLHNVRFQRGDALDESALLSLRPLPNLVLASGFYEILLDEEIIRRSLRLNARLLAPGGCLLFTTQVRHPQLRLISALLVNRQGRPWVMTTRRLAEVEGWAREAGFGRVESLVEAEGLFALTEARP